MFFHKVHPRNDEDFKKQPEQEKPVFEHDEFGVLWIKCEQPGIRIAAEPFLRNDEIVIDGKDLIKVVGENTIKEATVMEV